MLPCPERRMTSVISRSPTPVQVRLLRRLDAGEILWSWDVHHTLLRAALDRGVVLCWPSCRISIGPAGEAWLRANPVRRAVSDDTHRKEAMR